MTNTKLSVAALYDHYWDMHTTQINLLKPS